MVSIGRSSQMQVSHRGAMLVLCSPFDSNGIFLQVFSPELVSLVMQGPRPT